LLEGVHVVRMSSCYTSEPAFYEDQDLFTNAACELLTTRAPEDLLTCLLATEDAFGRVRAMANGPRTLDCDLLDYEGCVCSSSRLVLPHPGILQRDFVVTPLLEIAPDLVLADGTPVTRERIAFGRVSPLPGDAALAHRPATFSLCATPIGNLGDVTLRVLQTLRAADVIYAEDTRVTRKLLNHYGIPATVERCDENVARTMLPKLLARLEAQEHVALVTDAGMPGISDPGLCLVDAVRKAGHAVEVLPGASALTAALAASGICADSYCFGGFLPRTASARKARLESLAALPTAALVFFESPHRAIASLQAIAEALPARRVCMARELTKLHEEVLVATAQELCDVLAARVSAGARIKGEVVIVIGPGAATGNKAQGRDMPLCSCDADCDTLTRPQKAKLLMRQLDITREEAYAQASGHRATPDGPSPTLLPH
jgi:16S rRNA (cytidine1402-2'-O)-methyltransferase